MVTERDAEDENDELLPEYDFAKLQGGVRGKYSKQVRPGSSLVLLDPDVARAFPTSEAVNEALRLLVRVAERSAAKAGGEGQP
jgi:hypothetical protein